MVLARRFVTSSPAKAARETEVFCISYYACHMQTFLEKVKTLYTGTGLPPDKIVPTVGQNSCVADSLFLQLDSNGDMSVH